MQKYYSQPKEDGRFYVMSRNLFTGEIEEKPIGVCFTEAEAIQRVKELNEEYNKEFNEENNNQNNK